MSRTTSGNLTGRAAQTDLREQREMIRAAEETFSTRWNKAYDFLFEYKEDFERWYDRRPEQTNGEMLPVMEAEVEAIKTNLSSVTEPEADKIRDLIDAAEILDNPASVGDRAWLGDAMIATPLGKVYRTDAVAEHAEWLDEQATRESARP